MKKTLTRLKGAVIIFSRDLNLNSDVCNLQWYFSLINKIKDVMNPT